MVSDHKSIIYRYDATKGSSITLNQILPLLTARTSIPSLRNDISGDDKALAIAEEHLNIKPLVSQLNSIL